MTLPVFFRVVANQWKKKGRALGQRCFTLYHNHPVEYGDHPVEYRDQSNLLVCMVPQLSFFIKKKIRILSARAFTMIIVTYWEVKGCGDVDCKSPNSSSPQCVRTRRVFVKEKDGARLPLWERAKLAHLLTTTKKRVYHAVAALAHFGEQNFLPYFSKPESRIPEPHKSQRLRLSSFFLASS